MKVFSIVALLLFCPIVFVTNANKPGQTQGYVRQSQLSQLHQTKKLGIWSKSVICPGKKEQCGDGDTCCKLETGGYGCCRHKNAVCCSDKKHCCPHGYTCNISEGSCSKHQTSNYSHSNIVSKRTKTMIENWVQDCSDGTRCESKSGPYGCCPYRQAECCSDGEHCCPRGYTCDVSQRKCNKKSNLTRVLATIEVFKRSKAIKCDGGKEECPNRNTCCKLSSGRYGCCPLRDAICCSDGKHCCPHGYMCNLSEGKCVKQNERTDFLDSSASITKLKKIVCSENEKCPQHNTYCKSSSGCNACCPLPNAVCCFEGETCCPQDYICGTGEASCKPPSMNDDEETSIVN